MELKESEKLIKWATSIRNDRIAQWGQALHPDAERTSLSTQQHHGGLYTGTNHQGDLYEGEG